MEGGYLGIEILVREWLENTIIGLGGGLLLWVERRRREEERESALNYLVQMSLRKNKYMAEISSPKVTMVKLKPWLIR